MAEREAMIKKTKKKGRSTRKVNLARLYSAMNKMSDDAVDKEILRRFKILIDSCDQDLTKISVDAVVKDPDNVDIAEFHEGLQPYIRHYIFLVKKSAKGDNEKPKSKSKSKPKSTVRPKSVKSVKSVKTVKRAKAKA